MIATLITVSGSLINPPKTHPRLTAVTPQVGTPCSCMVHHNNNDLQLIHKKTCAAITRILDLQSLFTSKKCLGGWTRLSRPSRDFCPLHLLFLHSSSSIYTLYLAVATPPSFLGMVSPLLVPFSTTLHPMSLPRFHCCCRFVGLPLHIIPCHLSIISCPHRYIISMFFLKSVTRSLTITRYDTYLDS